MNYYKAAINLTVFVSGKDEDEAREQIVGEFVDRLISVTTTDSRFDFAFDLLQIDEYEGMRLAND